MKMMKIIMQKQSCLVAHVMIIYFGSNQIVVGNLPRHFKNTKNAGGVRLGGVRLSSRGRDFGCLGLLGGEAALVHASFFPSLVDCDLVRVALNESDRAVGVGVVRALIALGGANFCLKWPNDIIKNGKKIGGVLIEIGETRGNTVSVVIGIGLNIRQTNNFYKNNSLAAADLFGNGIRADRNQILVCLLIELKKIMETFVDGGFLSFRREWEKMHQYHGSKVDFVLSNGKKKEGMVRGVDSRGALLIERFGEVRKYTAGEIKLRVAE